MQKTEQGSSIGSRAAKAVLGLVTVVLTIMVVVLGAALLVFRSMDLGFCVAQGDSMLPSITDGTKLVLNPGLEPQRFDIIVYEWEGSHILKRVIGLPGDEITVIDGKLFINRQMYAEPYIVEENCIDFIIDDFKTVVPDGCYFVMGDNRDYSADSREIGPVPAEQVTGVAIMALD